MTEDQPTTTSTNPLRSIGFILALALGIHAIGLSYSGLVSFSSLAGIFPRADFISLIGPAGVLVMVFVFTFVLIGMAVRRSAPDYVLASRVLSAPLAFASSFTLVVFSGLAAGALIAAIPQNVIPSFLNLGSLLTGQDFSSAVKDISSPQGVALIGTMGVVLAFGASLLKPRYIQWILGIGLLLTAAAWLIVLIQMITATGSFQSAWDTYLGRGTYAEHLQAAQDLGISSQVAAQTTPLTGFFIVFWLGFGALAPIFVAGEVKRPQKTLFGSSLLAIALAGLIWIGVIFAVTFAIPPDFLTAESYLNQAGFKGVTLPYLTVYAGLLSPVLPLSIFTAIAWVYSMINLGQAYFLFTSRIIVSWANDQILPSMPLGYIHPTRQAPVIALFFSAVLALAGVMDAAQPGRLFVPAKFAFFASVCLILPVIAATLLPFLRKQWFQGMPALVRFKLGPIPLISAAGIVSLVFLLGVIVSVFFMPGQIQPFDWIDLIAFTVFFGAGILVYYRRKRSLADQGVELAKTFKDLPQGD